MNQLTFSLEEPRANHSAWQVLEKDLKIREETLCSPIVEYLISLDPSGSFGKTCQVSSVQTEDGILVPSSGRWQNSGMGSHIGCLTLSTLESPKDVDECLLSDVLEIGEVQQKRFLSPTACEGILRRAERRGKELPTLLRIALEHCAQEITKELAQTMPTQEES